jgi:hypothetical protein
MLNGWTIWQLSKIREKEILKEVEGNRLLHQSRYNRKTLNRYFRGFLDTLGRIFVYWGQYLQNRYGETVR